jgi:hypothetical protein
MKILGLFLLIALAAFGSPSLRYEPEEVTLSGVIRRQTFPGRPNYANIAKGDEPEVYWILELSTPVDVAGTKESDIDVAESGVHSMQLVFGVEGKKSYPDYADFVGKQVTVIGRLFHSHTAHHKTPVLIAVRDMKKEPNQSPQTTRGKAPRV